MSNSGLPWFRFYARDWLTDVKVMSMSCCARGAYIQLLALQWENGGLPNDWGKLAEMTGYSNCRAEDLFFEELGSSFDLGEDGLLRNARLEEMREEKRAQREAQSAGAKQAHANWLATQQQLSGKQEATLPPPTSSSSPLTLPSSSSLTPPSDADSTEDIEPSSSLPAEEISDAPHPVRKRKGGYPIEFESFWSAYPKRNDKRLGKKATYRKWRTLLPHRIDLLIAATFYAQSKIARVDGMAKDPERFLKEDYWRDWLDGPGTDEHVEERDRPRPAPQAPQGGPAADPDDVAAELGHRSFLEATRALSMEERLKKEEGE